MTRRQLDSVWLTDRQIFVLMKLYKRNHQKRPFVVEDLKRLGAKKNTLLALERKGYCKFTKKIDGWKITAHGIQLAETYDDRLVDL